MKSNLGTLSILAFVLASPVAFAASPECTQAAQNAASAAIDDATSPGDAYKCDILKMDEKSQGNYELVMTCVGQIGSTEWSVRLSFSDSPRCATLARAAEVTRVD